DGTPEARYIFVAAADAELLDTWHVRGMRGTGTHHFAVNDVFVPTERSVLSATAQLRETGPLYRIPRTLLFASGDAACALGMGRSCMEVFYALAGVKPPRVTPGLCAIRPWCRPTSARPRRCSGQAERSWPTPWARSGRRQRRGRSRSTSARRCAWPRRT